MAPVPLEGQQAPVVQTLAAEGQRGGSISLAVLIDFIVQRTYHELTVLAELLPRKTDMERKIEIYNFSARTRQLFVRLLALVKWANSASKVDKSAHIMAFLDKQSLLFVDTADMLARMARETLVHARLPNFHIPAAVEVLTTGTYGRLPLCIRDRIVPADPITTVERRSTLQRLNQVIQHRLVTGKLLPQMRNLKIDGGRVTFHVKHEFEVSLTVMGDGPNIPWRLLEVDILVEDKDTGEGKSLVHNLQLQYIHQVLQARLADHPNPLNEVYDFLHYFAQSLQLEVLYSQALRLKRDRLDNHIHVDDYVPGQRLTVWYWRELSTREPRCELGYKLTVQVDHHDSARPLAVVHSPSLGQKEVEIADRAIHSAVLSMERLLVHTIYVRTKARLSDLRSELQAMLPGVECTLTGVPAVLSVPLLQPCQRAEQMLVTVETHTGVLQCCVPQYEAPMIQEVTAALNGDHSRLTTLLSELRFWVMQRRCEKTLMHLPASVKERLPLLMPQDNPIASRLGRHRMLVQLHRHPSTVLIVDLREKEGAFLNVDCAFFLAIVRPAAASDEDSQHVMTSPEDAITEHEVPKPYLKVVSLMEFDTFVTTHGPWTSVEDVSSPGKRKLAGLVGREARQRSKHPAYFIPELAHVVALCDERIPFLSLAQEFFRREIPHQGLQVEAGATGLVLRLVSLPPPVGMDSTDPSYLALLHRLLSASIRACTRNLGRSWILELVFAGSSLQTLHPKEQGNRRPVYLQYEMLPEDCASRTVDAMLADWTHIARLHCLVEELAECCKIEKYNLPSMCVVKSYNYLKLILGYGPDKGATVNVQWKKDKKGFSLIFGASGKAVLAHSLVREQLEAHLNQHHSLVQIIHLLQETYDPLASILQLSSIPQLGINSQRPQVPVQTWTVIAQTPTLLRMVYQGTYCLELRLRSGGFVSIRDGAYSSFDRASVVADLMPTQGLKTFLSKYVTESAVSRRRSQSEDDNPPSPVTLDSESGSLMSGRGPQSPANQRDGLRFHPPLTPPSGSNPHTPASPHTSSMQNNQHQSFGSSPATSFSLASPPSLPAVNQSASPGVGLMSGSSPSNAMQMPSPLQMTSASPQPSMVGHSPAGSFMGGGHMDGSPFPASQGMASPAASNWPGSPGIPRPSPARPGQSPGVPSHLSLHSPDHKTDMWQQSRVLPQRFWAGAVPTVLTHKALDVLCRPCPMPPPGPNTLPPQVPPGTPDLCPLERFLGCIFMRRQMHRFIQSEETLSDLRTSEPGVVHFKTENLQCRVVLNPNHLQTLHMKVASLPDHKDQWALDEIQIIEKFFEMRVACPPFKPNALLALARMLSVPYCVLKDFVQLMKLDLMPNLAQQQNFKWSIQLCLRVPPSSAAPIVPTGQAGVLLCRSKILFFVQLTRLSPAMGEGMMLVLPLVYDVAVRNTQVAEKREPGPALAVSAANMQLKRFAEYSANSTMGQECTLLLAVRDLLMNLTLPTEVPQVVSPAGPPMTGPMPPQLQSPVGMMHSPMGMPGGPGMPTGMPGMPPGMPPGMSTGMPNGPGMPTGPGMAGMPSVMTNGPSMPPGQGMPGMPSGPGMPPGVGMPSGPGMPTGPGMPSGQGMPGMPVGPGMGPMGPGPVGVGPVGPLGTQQYPVTHMGAMGQHPMMGP